MPHALEKPNKVNRPRPKSAPKALFPGQLAELHALTLSGVSCGQIDLIKKRLRITQERLANLLKISRATLNRVSAAPESSLDVPTGERVIRIGRLFDMACAILGGEDNARAWLNQPQPGLKGQVPLKFAETETGSRAVEQLLGRIEYGVYA